MTLQRRTITEFLPLSSIQTDRFKTAVLTVTLSVPQDERNSAYHMLLSGILRRGTEAYGDLAAINRRLDDLYATCIEIRNQRVGKNLCLSFSAELLDERFSLDGTNITEGVMEMLAQIILHPKRTGGYFDADLVRQEIRFAEDSIRSEINNTRAFAATRLAELMHRDDPTYPTMDGLLSSLSSINEVSLTEYYEEFLSSATWQIFYVGSLSSETVSGTFARYFGNCATTTPLPLRLPAVEPSAGYLSTSVAMPVSQGKLAMGFRTGICALSHPEQVFAATLFNEVFGASPASKLFLNVREKMSLCYYCSSAYNRYTGILCVNSGIETKNRAVAERAILDQLRDLQDGKISDTELRAAKLSLENSYRQIYDNPFELQAFYGTRELFGISDDVESCREKLSSVTKEQIVAVAKGVTLDTVFFIEGDAACGEEEDCDD